MESSSDVGDAASEAERGLEITQDLITCGSTEISPEDIGIAAANNLRCSLNPLLNLHFMIPLKEEEDDDEGEEAKNQKTE